MRDHGEGTGLALKVHYESCEKVKYRTKDGNKKEKKDVISKSVPFFEFKKVNGTLLVAQINSPP